MIDNVISTSTTNVIDMCTGKKTTYQKTVSSYGITPDLLFLATLVSTDSENNVMSWHYA